MHRSRPKSREVRLAAVVAAGALALSTGAAGPARASESAPPTKAHRVVVQPKVQRVSKRPGAVQFGCQTVPLNATDDVRCYQPAQIQRAYAITPLLKRGLDGRGRTIVIVDAFSNPYVASDLAIFDATFGLRTPSFTQIAPQGLTPYDPTDPNQVGWAEEIDLDVQWAHAAAPGARIVLALARSNEDADILATTKYVVDHNIGDVISQSFGEAESCADPQLLKQQHRVFAQATRKHITLFASTGDDGAGQPTCDGSALQISASTPASDPFVTGVGGTTLDADTTTGAYRGETAWADPIFGCFPADCGFSGGGFSTIYPRPRYQHGISGTPLSSRPAASSTPRAIDGRKAPLAAHRARPGTAARAGSSSPGSGFIGRGVPDVAYNAGVGGGVLTHCGPCAVEDGGDPADPTVFYVFGGTSAGVPQWSALTTITDQIAHHRVGFINDDLYAISHHRAEYAATLHDIVSGNNDVPGLGGYDAARGWDPVTGLGTPRAVALVPDLAARSSR